MFHGDMVNSARVLYTPSMFAKTSLLYLQEIGKLQAKMPHVSRRENLSSYLFFMVSSGSGVLEYQHVPYELTAGDCVFIDCRKAYSHRTSDNLWKLKWIHFNGTAMANIYDKYRERGGSPRFHPNNLTDFDAAWQTLYDVAVSSDHIRDMRINESLTSLLTLLMQESWQSEGRSIGKKRASLLKVREYLDQNYQNHITLDELSGLFFINKFYLAKTFREEMGVTVNNYILSKRITHAKQLLRFTDKTLEAIGTECGMGAPTYFSRTFKKWEGISPSEYRKMW
ncbi:MAG: AraC family transcriptional regulator [Candidatus Gastranaerophilales bacterium]|nr:AraC family transcriptional regulator [Candidatus Gastranaerophilales bacterium]